MKWTVLYRPSAQDQLANIWLNEPDAKAVAEAADEIDRILAVNPLDVGESRGGNTRIIIERPLTVFYDVYPDEGGRGMGIPAIGEIVLVTLLHVSSRCRRSCIGVSYGYAAHSHSLSR